MLGLPGEEMAFTDSPAVVVLSDLTKEAIYSQLNRILMSPRFYGSPTASRFLSFVVSTALSGQSHHIKQYTIAVDAFGYPSDFDPHTNTTVRVLAGRLRGRLERYYLCEGVHDDIRIEIPKRTYVPVFRLNSTPPIEKSTDTPTITLSAEENDDYGRSVAVIAFTDHTPSDGNMTYAAGITESVIIGLSLFRELRVVGPLLENRTVIADANEIGRRYKIRFVLQGTLQMRGDVLRIKTYFTDTRTGFKIWSKVYEYTPGDTDFIDIEEDVTRQIVVALADYTGIIPRLISRESIKKRPDSWGIHDVLCNSVQCIKTFSMAMYLNCMGALEQFFKVNPDDPIVSALLSCGYCYHHVLDLGLENASLEKTERLAQWAIQIDPECQLAHLSEGILYFLQGRADACIAKLQLARSLNPFNSLIFYSSASITCMLGRWEEGMRLWRHATQLNPQTPIPYFIIGFLNLYRRQDFEAAWDYAKGINSQVYWVPLLRAAAAGQLDLHSQAQAALLELLELRPDFPLHARDLMRRYCHLDQHIEMLMDGLLKAGLKLKSLDMRIPPHMAQFSERRSVL